jgi:hypothetical protein
MSDILMQTDNMEFSIPPNVYLLDDFTSNTCSSLITANDNNLFVLGEPFFRMYNIKLNYLTTEITIYTPTKENYSPIVGAFVDLGSTITNSLSFVDSNSYYGPAYVGTPLQ